VNFVALRTAPFGAVVLVTVIVPVVAPAGTVAWSWVDEMCITLEAATPLNLTVAVEVNPTPLIVTTVPTGPLGGLKPVIDSVGMNCPELVPVPSLSLTEMADWTAPLGTVALSWVPEMSLADEASEPNFTFTPVTNPVPVIVTELPVMPEVGVNEVTVGAP
jgi:hypothetical protein